MKLLELEVDETIYDEVLAKLKDLPEEKLKVRRLFDDSHIPSVLKEEQAQYEKELKNPDCHIIVDSEVIKL